MEGFNQIEQKKRKALPNTFSGDFKNMFFKPILPVNKSKIVLLEENSNLIETYFGGMEETLVVELIV